MNEKRFAAWTRSWSGLPSRRHLLRGLASAVLGWGTGRLPEPVEAKKKAKPKPKPSTGLCARNGSKCRRPGKDCKKRYCLTAPFTISATWTETTDHDTYLFVPPQDAATGPSPYLYFRCTPETTTCEEAYPFACVDGDEREIGDEVATVHRLLPGRYEYWLDLYDPSLAGAATVTIRAATGRVVRQWTSPDTRALDSSAWHVFDFDGRDGRVTAIDELAPGPMPDAAHDPSTTVCPND